MVHVLRQYGLFSIMQAKKKRYWPRGMREQDIVEPLGVDFGSMNCMKSTTDGVFVAALRDKKPKVVVTSCGSTSPGEIVRRHIGDELMTMTRPAAFEEYEKHEGNDS